MPDGRAGTDGAQRARPRHAALGAGRLRPARCRCRTGRTRRNSPGRSSATSRARASPGPATSAAHLPFEPGVLDLCKTALKTFEALGCTVEEARPDYPIERVWQNWRTLRAWQAGSALKDLYNDPAKRALMKPEAQFEVESGQKLSAYDIYDANAVRTAWYQAVRAFFERYDYFLLPSARCFRSTPTTDWPKAIAGKTMDTYHRWMEVMIPVTMSSCPALSVPVGFNERGLPMGLQIVGPNHGELACLQLAHAYDQATQWVAKRRRRCCGRRELRRAARALLAVAHHEIEIAQIDEHAEALAQR